MSIEKIENIASRFTGTPTKIRSAVVPSKEHCPECDELMGRVPKNAKADGAEGGVVSCKSPFYLCTNSDGHESGKPVAYVKRSTAGRKKLDDSERRDVSVSCRLTNGEIKELDKKRGTMRRGEYLRLAAFKKAPKPVPELNREAWADLARVGGNLNQIAKRLNEGDAANIEDIRKTLNELRTALLTGKEVFDES